MASPSHLEVIIDGDLLLLVFPKVGQLSADVLPHLEVVIDGDLLLLLLLPKVGQLTADVLPRAADPPLAALRDLYPSPLSSLSSTHKQN